MAPTANTKGRGNETRTIYAGGEVVQKFENGVPLPLPPKPPVKMGFDQNGKEGPVAVQCAAGGGKKKGKVNKSFHPARRNEQKGNGKRSVGELSGTEGGGVKKKQKKNKKKKIRGKKKGNKVAPAPGAAAEDAVMAEASDDNESDELDHDDDHQADTQMLDTTPRDSTLYEPENAKSEVQKDLEEKDPRYKYEMDVLWRLNEIGLAEMSPKRAEKNAKFYLEAMNELQEEFEKKEKHQKARQSPWTLKKPNNESTATLIRHYSKAISRDLNLMMGAVKELAKDAKLFREHQRERGIRPDVPKYEPSMKYLRTVPVIEWQRHKRDISPHAMTWATQRNQETEEQKKARIAASGGEGCEKWLASLAAKQAAGDGGQKGKQVETPNGTGQTTPQPNGTDQTTTQPNGTDPTTQAVNLNGPSSTPMDVDQPGPSSTPMNVDQPGPSSTMGNDGQSEEPVLTKTRARRARRKALGQYHYGDKERREHLEWMQSVALLHKTARRVGCPNQRPQGYLDLLPIELLQKVLVYLPLPTLCKLRRLSAKWNRDDGWPALVTAPCFKPTWEIVDLTPYKLGKKRTRSVGLQYLIEKCGHMIKELKLHRLKMWQGVIDTNSLRAIVGKCPLLESLELPANESLQDRHFRRVTCRQTPEMALQNTSLRKLNIASNSQLTQSTIVHISYAFPNLTHLNINHCTKLMSKSFRMIPRFMPQLESLSVKGCLRFGDEGFYCVVGGCKNLRELYCDNTSVTRWTLGRVRPLLIARAAKMAEVEAAAKAAEEEDKATEDQLRKAARAAGAQREKVGEMIFSNMDEKWKQVKEKVVEEKEKIAALDAHLRARKTREQNARAAEDARKKKEKEDEDELRTGMFMLRQRELGLAFEERAAWAEKQKQKEAARQEREREKVQGQQAYMDEEIAAGHVVDDLQSEMEDNGEEVRRVHSNVVILDYDMDLDGGVNVGASTSSNPPQLLPTSTNLRKRKNTAPDEGPFAKKLRETMKNAANPQQTKNTTPQQTKDKIPTDEILPISVETADPPKRQKKTLKPPPVVIATENTVAIGLEVLSMSHLPHMKDEGFQDLALFPKLRDLTMWNMRGVTPEGAENFWLERMSARWHKAGKPGEGWGLKYCRESGADKKVFPSDAERL
ncbi:F-box and leucine-rich repeat protein 4 [Rhizophlyctis rosea]|uniref:F-box and leucine-rich repeat protein 4 n=1 Tax=Rhizophlyctis rosea TaxID=64517 RepID=A0AAD5X0D5_9FUNG|nr:F-box and leucine-rich repeat protein 4 [Rhizophlyctis rosea]